MSYFSDLYRSYLKALIFLFEKLKSSKTMSTKAIKNTVYCSLTIFLIVFLFQNCGQYQAQVNQKKSLSSVQCKTQTSFTTPFDENEIQISRPLLSAETASENEQKTETSETELSLVVDTLCLSSSENPVLVLGQVVEVPHELSWMKRVAVNLNIQGDIDFNQLTEDMKNPCLIGITENRTLIQTDSLTGPDNTEEERQVSVSLNSGSNSPTVKEQSNTATAKFNDPMVKDQKHLDFLNHSQSVDLQNQITEQIENPVVVAVLGTYLIGTLHPDLEGRLWDDGQGNYGFVGGGNRNARRNGDSAIGIIAAKQNNETGVVGLAGDYVKIMTLGAGPGATDLYNGMRYAIEKKVDVIEIAVFDAPILIQSVLEAVNEGIVVTTAVGDETTTGREISSTGYCNVPVCFGRSINGMLAVTAVDMDSGNLWNGLWVGRGWPRLFSNYSPEFVEIAAPGGPSMQTTAGTGGYMDYSDGSRVASPVVAAAAAFVVGFFKANNIDYTPESVENFLKDKGSRSSESLEAHVQEGRIVDFGVITENLESLKEEKEKEEKENQEPEGETCP